MPFCNNQFAGWESAFGQAQHHYTEAQQILCRAGVLGGRVLVSCDVRHSWPGTKAGPMPSSALPALRTEQQAGSARLLLSPGTEAAGSSPWAARCLLHILLPTPKYQPYLPPSPSPHPSTPCCGKGVMLDPSSSLDPGPYFLSAAPPCSAGGAAAAGNPDGASAAASSADAGGAPVAASAVKCCEASPLAWVKGAPARCCLLRRPRHSTGVHTALEAGGADGRQARATSAAAPTVAM